MTECLPVADVALGELDTLDGTSHGRGVCVGAPVQGVTAAIAPLAFDATLPVTTLDAGATGEVLVRASWCSDGYDGLWATERSARPADADGRAWHRTGDVGHLDAAGRLWIEGRTVHVIDAVDGAITPVPVELAAEAVDTVTGAAAVGVGPTGCQQLVVVVRADGEGDGLASEGVTDAVRAAVRDRTGRTVAAVLAREELPVDIRHGTKIDRTALGGWAAAVLAGR
jgi:acyl-coenzyme A synthetase/AMP-(fatty) acid ligase